jgi:hypothetical protein
MAASGPWLTWNKQCEENRMHRSALTFYVLFVALASASAQSLYGNLKPGSHAVGYRAIPLVDKTRAAIGDLTREIKPTGAGRPIALHIWYPAVANSGSPLTYSHYISALSNMVLQAQHPKSRTADELFVEQVTDLQGDTKAVTAKLPALKHLALWARARAAPAKGRFPLVIYPDFRAPATNSILCEYLTSHGYVVATLAMTGARDLPYQAGRTNIVTLTEDILFVRAELERHAFVDTQNTAVMGVGIAASSALLASMRQPAIRALVSLDGGIPTQFEDTLLKQIPDYDVTLFRIPMLAIMQEDHPSVDSAFLNQYKYSDRYLRDFKKMTEFYFINYGNLEALVPGIIGKPPGDTAAGFGYGADYVRDFLGATLRADAASRRQLASTPEARGIPAGDVLSRELQALPEPLSYHEIRAMITRDGIAPFKQWYVRAREKDPQPVPNQTMSELLSWLSFTGDTDGAKRLEVGKMRVEMYPQSARAHFSLAQHMKNLKLPEARPHYEQALAVLTNDADPMLDPSVRKRIEDVCKKELAPN